MAKKQGRREFRTELVSKQEAERLTDIRRNLSLADDFQKPKHPRIVQRSNRLPLGLNPSHVQIVAMGGPSDRPRVSAAP